MKQRRSNVESLRSKVTDRDKARKHGKETDHGITELKKTDYLARKTRRGTEKHRYFKHGSTEKNKSRKHWLIFFCLGNKHLETTGKEISAEARREGCFFHFSILPRINYLTGLLFKKLFPSLVQFFRNIGTKGFSASNSNVISWFLKCWLHIPIPLTAVRI